MHELGVVLNMLDTLDAAVGAVGDGFHHIDVEL